MTITTTDRTLPFLLAGFARAALSLRMVAHTLVARHTDAVNFADVANVHGWARTTRAIACEAYDVAQLHYAVERLHGATRAVDAQITLHHIGDARRIVREILAACEDASDHYAASRSLDAQNAVGRMLGQFEALNSAAARLAAAHA